VNLVFATVDDNVALRDGGVWTGGLLEAIGTTVSNDSAGRNGGGLYVARGSRAVVLDSTFQGNDAGRHGGAVEDLGIYLPFAVTDAATAPDDVSRRV
jgi:hypothetical protein